MRSALDAGREEQQYADSNVEEDEQLGAYYDYLPTYLRSRSPTGPQHVIWMVHPFHSNL